MLNSSAEVGTFLAGMSLPWPPVRRCLAEQRFSDGALTIHQIKDARLAVEIYKTSSEGLLLADRAESCPIICHDPARIIFTVAWIDYKIAYICINEKYAYSTDGDQKVEKCINIRSKPFTPAIRKDFRPENQAAVEKRRGRLARWVRNPDRIQHGRDYAFLSLKGEILQLKDLKSSVESGKYYHLPGMMARTRLLLIGKPMGLLQICAAYQDAPLTLYTTANPDRLPIGDATSLEFNASKDTSDPACQNPIDLDIWLRQFGLILEGKEYNNDLIIREIGNTIASHRDLDGQHSVSFLMSGRYGTIDNITRFSLMVSDVVLHLAECLLSEEGIE